MRIGRSLSAELRFEDPTVSRRHAVLLVEEDGVRVLDDRSLNGVFVNGDRVLSQMLADGDEIVIGRYRLHFYDRSAVAAAPASGLLQAE
jgi:pSer/pThr/pTyr-binding forkhead associated (FHA) protein